MNKFGARGFFASLASLVITTLYPIELIYKTVFLVYTTYYVFNLKCPSISKSNDYILSIIKDKNIIYVTMFYSQFFRMFKF